MAQQPQLRVSARVRSTTVPVAAHHRRARDVLPWALEVFEQMSLTPGDPRATTGSGETISLRRPCATAEDPT